MSVCYTAPYTIPAATLGPDNPLPDIKNVSYIHAQIESTPAVPKRLTSYIDKGMVQTLLPYTQQDCYDRSRVLRSFKAVILENEHLKATFIPELGGRLWSLWDKDSNRELLYCNPVFQPGNLALRNAWFSGGVEFNVSIKGHHPMTCSDMFARHITMADGTPGIRMYEYERIRGTAYGFDAWLPEGSRFLFIRPRIENNTDHAVWTYWWSNIAVPYTNGMRVIAPADKTFVNYADDNHYFLDFADVPVARGVDISYPKNVKIAQDFFFYIPDRAPKWIAAVDEKGLGLVQCSTRNLLGRKLFVWGDSHGGDNWKNFLSDGTNEGYLVDEKWQLRLEKALQSPENQSWFGWMHLGLMRYANRDVSGALAALETSLALAPSPWVLRNIAMIHGNEYGDPRKAVAYMERSVQLERNNRWLWLDMAVLCLKADLCQYWVECYPSIPEAIRSEGRLKLYTAIALTRLGRLEEACGYLNHDLLVPDIKEDENLITEAWFALYGAVLTRKTGVTDPALLREMVEKEYPLEELDFRMH